MTKELHLKKIKFNGKKHQILLQESNGPCALIAIYNHLVLTDANFSFNSASKSTKTSLTYVTELIAAKLSEKYNEVSKQCTSGISESTELNKSLEATVENEFVYSEQEMNSTGEKNNAIRTEDITDNSNENSHYNDERKDSERKNEGCDFEPLTQLNNDEVEKQNDIKTVTEAKNVNEAQDKNAIQNENNEKQS